MHEGIQGASHRAAHCWQEEAKALRAIERKREDLLFNVECNR